MATISASPRVAPLRWSGNRLAGDRRPGTTLAPHPAVTSRAGRSEQPELSELDLSGHVAHLPWRLAAGIVIVFVVTLVLSGLFTQTTSSAGGPSATVVQGPAETAAHPAYTVLPGDTLWGIAQRLRPAADPRTTVGEIRELNGLSAGHVLRSGEVLMLPDAG